MNEYGVITELKRFAVHDGPGIRTVLFLKGCTLHCRWCHNPETILPHPELAFFAHKCIGCRQCAVVCPAAVHDFAHRTHLLHRNDCIECGRCVRACPTNALRLYGTRITVAEAIRMLTEDREFYGDTGGVTLSGGEPLYQTDFICALLAELKKRHIHCAIDTCGNVPWKCFEKIIPVTDMFLYDIKHIETAAHRHATGAANDLILENLQKLSQTNKPIEIRMPIIPGFNDSDDDVAKAAELLSGLANITGVRLLPYHSLARSKYAALDLPDTMPCVAPPTRIQLERIGDIMAGKSIKLMNIIF